MACLLFTKHSSSTALTDHNYVNQNHMNPLEKFNAAISSLPLVAILRGVQASEAVAIGQALVEGQWTLIEVPLNSPLPLDSIAKLAASQPNALIGAGTVLTVADVRNVHAAGGHMVVSPNFDAQVVRATRDLGMLSLPGVITPSEAFGALQAGANGLKLFPAEMISPAVVKAMRAVLPPEVKLLPVGGINAADMAVWRKAGVSGFGIGSALYKPGMTAEQVKERAQGFAAAWAGTLAA
jgi:2-dehydro-3-deoxyphosphogalactonate aldolase